MGPRHTPSTTSQRRRVAAALTVVGFALVVVAVGGTLRQRSADPQLDTTSQLERVLPLPVPARYLEKPAVPAPSVKRPRRQWMQMPAPVRVLVPAIGLSARVIPVGRNADGTMQTPSSFSDTGWFAPGPEPGEKGAAILVGHVDSRRGPGVFYHLRALHRGDRITVVLRDRHRVRFVVTGSRQAAKAAFPAELVYAPTSRPTLRLVTCGGRFDRSTRHYVDNYIVFAHMAGIRG